MTVGKCRSIDDGIGTDTDIDPEFSAPEGGAKVRSHRRRERSRELVQMTKKAFRKKTWKTILPDLRF